jgi:hypothetical protein
MEPVKFCNTAPPTPQDREIEDRVLQTCARARVACVGILQAAGDTPVAFCQATIPTIKIPLAAFQNPTSAIELIEAALRDGGAR